MAKKENKFKGYDISTQAVHTASAMMRKQDRTPAAAHGQQL